MQSKLKASEDDEDLLSSNKKTAHLH